MPLPPGGIDPAGPVVTLPLSLPPPPPFPETSTRQGPSLPELVAPDPDSKNSLPAPPGRTPPLASPFLASPPRETGAQSRDPRPCRLGPSSRDDPVPTTEPDLAANHIPGDSGPYRHCRLFGHTPGPPTCTGSCSPLFSPPFSWGEPPGPFCSNSDSTPSEPLGEGDQAEVTSPGFLAEPQPAVPLLAR